MHEILCRRFESQFDNRMLQLKNPMRVRGGLWERLFPLLYSKFRLRKFFG